MDGLKASIHLFKPKHFLMPFLAHALGTLAAAFVASLIVPKDKVRIALYIGTFFLLGGITNLLMLPSPTGFMVVDMFGAYIPMAWIGVKLNKKN